MRDLYTDKVSATTKGQHYNINEVPPTFNGGERQGNDRIPLKVKNMLKVKTNALNAKGNLRPNVRSAIKDEIAEVVVVFKNGKTASLSYQGHGDYYGNIAECEDITIRGNAHLAITINDYVYNAPTRKPKANDNETIEIE